jgi:hypothetical protein
MGDQPYTRKLCSGCGETSWDSDTGNTFSRHAPDPSKPRVTVPCDTDGGWYDDMGNRLD